MRAMRAWTTFAQPPLLAWGACLGRAKCARLGLAWGLPAKLCALRARFARVPHRLGALYPPPLCLGGLPGVLRKSRLPPPPLPGGTCQLSCVRAQSAFCARPITPGALPPPPFAWDAAGAL